MIPGWGVGIPSLHSLVQPQHPVGIRGTFRVLLFVRVQKKTRSSAGLDLAPLALPLTGVPLTAALKSKI